MSKAYKTLKEIELDLVVKSGLIQQLKLKVEELQQRINEAIEYIEYYLAKGKTKNHRKFDISVLEILKGVDKEDE